MFQALNHGWALSSEFLIRAPDWNRWFFKGLPSSLENRSRGRHSKRFKIFSYSHNNHSMPAYGNAITAQIYRDALIKV